MKRTELTRRTPLKRKQRLRPVSKKTAKTRRETDPQRDFYVKAAQGCCENCGRQRELECHEIPAGSHRQRAIKEPNAWLALCRECHDLLQGRPYREQYMVKCLAVAASLNRCVGREVISLAGMQYLEEV